MVVTFAFIVLRLSGDPAQIMANPREERTRRFLSAVMER
jgi:ABC-type histidine transport system ATPase subunit